MIALKLTEDGFIVPSMSVSKPVRQVFTYEVSGRGEMLDNTAKSDTMRQIVCSFIFCLVSASNHLMCYQRDFIHGVDMNLFVLLK